MSNKHVVTTNSYTHGGSIAVRVDPNICTVETGCGPSAYSNGICGQPSVHTWITAKGIRYHECAEHHRVAS